MTITRTVRVIKDRFGKEQTLPGEDVTHEGQTWFHPYSGQAPTRVS